MKSPSSPKEKKLKSEIEKWKETCEILGDKNTLKSIQKSLQQIANGQGIPLKNL